MPIKVDVRKDDNAEPPTESDYGLLCPHDKQPLIAFVDGVRCLVCDRFYTYLNPVRFYIDE